MFDFVRVSRALLELPRIAAAFERGEIPYALVSKLTHVAEDATEGEWLELAARENTAALSFAIEAARRKNRKAPATGRFGLPGKPVKIAFELAPEEHAIVEKALRKAAREAGERRLQPRTRWSTSASASWRPATGPRSPPAERRAGDRRSRSSSTAAPTAPRAWC